MFLAARLREFWFADAGSGETPQSEKKTPWLVPLHQPLELSFFQKVFKRLREECIEQEEHGAAGVPLFIFHRAMSRLFRVLQEDDKAHSFDSGDYDQNHDGTVGWWEFCQLWKQEQLSIRLSNAERIYLTLEDPQQSRIGQITSIFVLTAIIISAGSFIVSTLPTMQAQKCERCAPVPFDEFAWIDTVCVILFTIEYCVRLVTACYMRMELLNKDDLIDNMCTDECIEWPTKSQRITNFITAWPNVIDLAAILPSYVAWIIDGLSEHRENDESGGGGNGAGIVLKLIRLMRVVRAFRLGRRFEAVVIIARSMHRSMRALWVLMLNLSLGMLIFGAIMFFMEGGDYDKDTGLFQRIEGWGMGTNGSYYEEIRGKSPFESIPHSFWWALVTATTVGYGDVSPTTMWGKITAFAAMVWSLSVLALPVGVIGNNFEKVWKEFDREKELEKINQENEARMVKEWTGSIDPLSLSRQLHLDVYHDSQMPNKANDVFIGEADVSLEMAPTGEPNSRDTVHKQLQLRLQENRKKSDRKVAGTLYVNYTWKPAQDKNIPAGSLLEGELDIHIVKAEKLVHVDWKDTGLSDPYVVATLFPKSPDPKSGVISPSEATFSTKFDEATPQWNETQTFHFCWNKEGVQAKKDADRQIRSQIKVPSDDVGKMLHVLPKLQGEVSELQAVLPRLNDEVRQLRADMRTILTHLGVQPSPNDEGDEFEGRTYNPDGGRDGLEAEKKRSPKPGGSADLPPKMPKLNGAVVGGQGVGSGDAAGGGAAPTITPRDGGEGKSKGGSQQPTPRSQAASDFEFVVPGVVPEEEAAGSEEGRVAEATGAGNAITVPSAGAAPLGASSTPRGDASGGGVT